MEKEIELDEMQKSTDVSQIVAKRLFDQHNQLVKEVKLIQEKGSKEMENVQEPDINSGIKEAENVQEPLLAISPVTLDSKEDKKIENKIKKQDKTGLSLHS